MPLRKYSMTVGSSVLANFIFLEATFGGTAERLTTTDAVVRTAGIVASFKHFARVTLCHQLTYGRTLALAGHRTSWRGDVWLPTSNSERILDGNMFGAKESKIRRGAGRDKAIEVVLAERH